MAVPCAVVFSVFSAAVCVCVCSGGRRYFVLFGFAKLKATGQFLHLSSIESRLELERYLNFLKNSVDKQVEAAKI